MSIARLVASLRRLAQSSNVILITAALVALPASAEERGTATVGGRFSSDMAEAYLSILAPLSSTDDSLLFLNPRFSLKDGGENEGNFGIGYRKLFGDKAIFGANLYADRSRTRFDNSFDQWGLGLEFLTDSVDFRANYYNPGNDTVIGATADIDTFSELIEVQKRIDQMRAISRSLIDSRTATVSNDFYQGNNLLNNTRATTTDVFRTVTTDTKTTTTTTTSTKTFTDLLFEKREGGLEGYDLELGYKLPLADNLPEVRVFGGYYDFEGPFDSEIKGAKGRLEVRAGDYLTFDAEVFEDEELHGSDYYVGARLNMPFSFSRLFDGKNPFLARKDDIKRFRNRPLAARLGEEVLRDVNIHVAESDFAENIARRETNIEVDVDEKVEVDVTKTSRTDSVVSVSESEETYTADGELITLTHVDSNSAGSDEGTFENPNTTLTSANITQSDDANDIVLIHSDSTFNNESIDVTDNQMVVGQGGGIDTSIETDQGTVLLPQANDGTATPVITGGGVNINSSNVTVTNLEIDGGSITTASGGEHSDLTITDVSISNSSGDAISLGDNGGSLSGDITLTNIVIANSGDDGIDIQNLVNGANLTADTISITGSADDGLDFDDVAAATINVNNLSITDSADAGITLGGFEVGSTASFSNAEVENSGIDGIRINLVDAGATVSFANTDISDSSENGFDATDVSGTVSFDSQSSITNSADHGVLVTGGALDLTYSGTIDHTLADAGEVIQIDGTEAASSILFNSAADDAIVDTNLGIYLIDAEGDLRISADTELTGLDGIYIDSSNGTYTFDNTHLTDILGVGAAGGSAFGAVDIFNSNATVTFGEDSSINQSVDLAAVSVGENVAGDNSVLTFNGTINATNGDGLQFDSADGSYTFNGTTTLNGGDAGIDILDNSSGTFTFNNVTITNPTNEAVLIHNLDGGTVNVNNSTIASNGTAATVDLDGGNGTITFANTDISQAGTGNVVSITDFGAGENVLFDSAGSITATANNNQGVFIDTIDANVTLANATLSNTVGDAVTIDDSSGQFNLSNVDINNAGDDGVQVTNLDGVLQFQQGSTVNGAVGHGLNVDGQGNSTVVQIFGTAGATDISNVGLDAIHIQDTTGTVAISDVDTANVGDQAFDLENTGAVTIAAGLTFADVANGLFINQAGTHTITGADLTTLIVDGGSAIININGSTFVNNTNQATISVLNGHNGAITTDAATTFDITNGSGFQFNNADGTYTFNGINTFNGGDAGIDIIDGSSGTFVFGAGTQITNPSGIALNVFNSSANVQYNGAIAQNNAVEAINIANNTGGSVTFGGQVTANTSISSAVSISNNTGTTTFNGGLDLNTTTGTALLVNNGGTLNITNGGNESIVTNGGGAVQIAGTDTNIIFDSITGTGAGSGTGIDLGTSGAGSTFTVSGTTQLSDYATAIQLNDNQGTATFGVTDITLGSAADARGIDYQGTNGASNFGVTTISNVGAGADQVGIDFANSTLVGASQFTSVDISGPDTSTDSVAVDLTALQGNQTVRLGEPVRVGASSHITDVHRGVVIDNTAAVQFTFGDGEDATDTGSTIDVNGQAGAFTVDAAGGTLAASNFNFDDVMVGVGDIANLPAGANSPVFVSEAGGTVNSGTNNLNNDVTTISVADALAQVDTDQLFVLVGDGGGDIDVIDGGADGFSLLEGQRIDSFNGGNTISAGSVQPANITGNIGSTGLTYTSDDVTASNTFAGATGVITIDGAGNNQVSNFSILTPLGATAGVVVQNVASNTVTLSNLTIDNGTSTAVALSANGQTVNLNNVDLVDLNMSGANTGTALTISGATHAGQVVVGSGSDLGNTTGTVISTNIGDNILLLDTSSSLLNVSGNTQNVIDIAGLAAGSNVVLGAISADGVTADSVLRVQNMSGGNINSQAITITNFGDALTDTAIDIDGTGGTLNFNEIDIAATSGNALALEGQTLTITSTDNDISTVDGTAIDLDGTALTATGVTFNQVTGNSSTQSAVAVNNTTGGALTLSTASLSGGAATTGLEISGNARSSDVIIGTGTITNGVTISDAGTGAVTIDADISTSTGYAVQVANRAMGAGLVDINGTVSSNTGAVSIQNNTGGIVQFDGVVTGTGANTAGVIDIDGNTGGFTNFNALVDIDVTGNGRGVMIGSTNTSSAAINFNGGLDINSVNGIGFNAEGGTVGVADAATESVVVTGTAGAINISDVTVAAGGISFDQVTTASTATSDSVVIDDATSGDITFDSVDLNGTIGTRSLEITGNSRSSNVLVSGGTINGQVLIQGDGTGTVVVDADVASAGDYAVQTNLRGAGAGAVTFNGAISSTNIGSVFIGTTGAGAGDVTFNNTISGTGTSVNGVVRFDANNGGTTNFNGLVSADMTGGGVGVQILASDNSNINFNGGLDIDTVNGAGFNALGGTVAVANAGTESITTTGTGTALNIDGATIAASGLNLDTVSSSVATATGAAINLNNVSGGAINIDTATLTGSGVDVAGTLGSALTINDLDIALNADNQTAVDFSSATVNGNVATGDIDIISSSSTGTVGVNLVDATGTGVIQLGDTNTNGGENASITGVNDGVLFSSTTDLDFTFGDGSSTSPDGIQSSISAVTPIGDNGTGLPAGGSYDFNDVTLTGDTSALAGPDVYYVDAAGAGTGATQTSAGSIAGAELSGADAIVLIDTTEDNTADTIDQASAPHISAGLTNSLELADGQILLTLFDGQVIDLGTLGLSGGAPSSFEVNVAGSAVITGASTLDTLTPILTTNNGDTVVLSGSAVVQNVTLTNSGTGNGLSLTTPATNAEVSISSSTITGGSAGAGILIDGSGAGTVTITEFGDNTVVDAGGNGIDITDVTFDADTTTAGIQQVAAGNTSIGLLSNRITGDGLRLNNVLGDIAFGTLNIFNDTGTGLFVRDAGGKGGTFSLSNSGGTIDTINGTAIDIDPVLTDLTFATVLSTNANGQGSSAATAGGVFLDAVDAQGGAAANALTIGSLSVTNAGGTGVRVNNSNGQFNFGATTINGTTSGHGVHVSDSDADISFTSLDIDNVAASGVLLSGIADGSNTGDFSVSGLTDINGTGAGAVVVGNHAGATSFGDVTINNRGGAGLQFDGFNDGTQNIDFGNVTINNQLTSNTSAIAIDNINGVGSTVDITSVDIDGGGSIGAGIALSNNDGATININGGLIENAGGAGLSISNSAGDVTYAGTIANTTGRSVQILTNENGANITLSGAISDSGTGVLIDNNDQGGGNATVNLSGTLTLTTGTDNAFTATNGGVVTVTGAGNTINTTTGTAVNINGTTIGASGVTFRSVSSNGATNGIVLNNTGASGGFTVTGDGSGAQNGSGGLIQNSTGDGISLTNTSNVSITQLNLTDNAQAADAVTGDDHEIDINNVTNFTYQDAVINGFGTAVPNHDDQHSISILNLFGTSLIDNVIFNDINEDGIEYVNNTTDDGNQDVLTVSNSVFNNHLAINGETGIQAEAAGTANMGLIVTNTDFNINGNGSLGILFNSTGTSTSSLTVNGGSSFDATNSFGAGTIQTNNADTSSSTILIDGIVVTGSPFNGLNILNNDNATTNVTIRNSQISGDGTATQNGFGIRVSQDGNGIVNALVDNNTISSAGTFGFDSIRLEAGDTTDGTGRLNATITGNTTVVPNIIGAGLNVVASETNTVCVDVSGNTLAGSETFPGFDDDVIFNASTAGATILVEQTSLANVQALNGANTGFVGGVGTVTFSGGNCPQP